MIKASLPEVLRAPPRRVPDAATRCARIILCRSAALIFSRSLRCAARRPSAEWKGLFFCLPGIYASSRDRRDSATCRAIIGLLSVVPRCGTGVLWRVFLSVSPASRPGPNNAAPKRRQCSDRVDSGLDESLFLAPRVIERSRGRLRSTIVF